MSLKNYLLTLDAAALKDLADECECSVGHLRNCAYGSRQPNAQMAAVIERRSKGQVTRKELLPAKKYRAIWSGLKAA